MTCARRGSRRRIRDAHLFHLYYSMTCARLPASARARPRRRRPRALANVHNCARSARFGRFVKRLRSDRSPGPCPRRRARDTACALAAQRARFAVHGVDEHRDVLRRRARHDAVAEIEDVARRGACRANDALASRATVAASVEQHERIEVALQRDAIADARGARRRDRPSSRGRRASRAARRQGSAAARPPPLVNTIAGTRVASGAGASARSTARIGSSEKRGTHRVVSNPPQVSKSMTASAPARICSSR